MSVNRNVTVPVGRVPGALVIGVARRKAAPDRTVAESSDRPYAVPIRSARVASIAIAASGRSRRMAFRPAPPIDRPRTSTSAMTVAARGRSRRTASSPMWSPAAYDRRTPRRRGPLDAALDDHDEGVVGLALRGRAPAGRVEVLGRAGRDPLEVSGASPLNSGTRRRTSIRAISSRVSVVAGIAPPPVVRSRTCLASTRVHGSGSSSSARRVPTHRSRARPVRPPAARPPPASGGGRPRQAPSRAIARVSASPERRQRRIIAPSSARRGSPRRDEPPSILARRPVRTACRNATVCAASSSG